MHIQSVRRSRKNVSIHLSCLVHLCAHFGSQPHAPSSVPVGSVSVRIPSALTPSDPLAAVHAMLIYQLLAHGNSDN